MHKKEHGALVVLSLAVAIVSSWLLIHSPSDRRVAVLQGRAQALTAGTRCLTAFLSDVPRQQAERRHTHAVLKTASLHVSPTEAIRHFGHDLFDLAGAHKVTIGKITPKDRVAVLTPDSPPTPTPECAIAPLDAASPSPAAAAPATPANGTVATGPGIRPAGLPAANAPQAVVTYEIQLVGRYDDLLGAIHDLSEGSILARVSTPTFHRVDDNDRSRDPILQATVPVTLFVGEST